MPQHFASSVWWWQHIEGPTETDDPWEPPPRKQASMFSSVLVGDLQLLIQEEARIFNIHFR